MRWPELALVVALAVAAPAHAAGGPAPPVIHEPFTPLPCPIHPDTTIDVEGCQEARILRTDRAIDDTVAAVFRLLRTDRARASFVDGERHWLHYRRESCLAEASAYAGGSAEPVAYLSCTLRKNRSHLVGLAAMRRTLTRH
jgi:uncharacterized protein YecT (DUF1311 family)